MNIRNIEILFLGVIDPDMMVQAIGRTDLDELAKSVLIKLQTALNAV